MVTSRIFKFRILNFSLFFSTPLFRAVRARLTERLAEEAVFHGCHQFVSILFEDTVSSFSGVSYELMFMEEKKFRLIN